MLMLMLWGEGTWEGKGPGGEGSSGEKDPDVCPGSPGRSPEACLDPQPHASRTAVTPQPQYKCYFNSSCSSDPVISPPIKGKLPHFRCKLSTVTPSPWYLRLQASKQKQPKQDRWQPSLATFLHLPGLRSGGSRLLEAAFLFFFQHLY